MKRIGSANNNNKGIRSGAPKGGTRYRYREGDHITKPAKDSHANLLEKENRAGGSKKSSNRITVITRK